MNVKQLYESDILSAVVGLTSQKNGHEMTKFMLDWINSWEFTSSALLFDVYFVSADNNHKKEIILHQFADDISETRIISKDPSLITCAKEKHQLAIDLDNKNTQLIFPVESSSGRLRIICITGENMGPHERLSCMHLVTLYTNQINVFDEKERDALTGLLNRQTFDIQFAKVLAAKLKSDEEAYLAILDIDHFKKVNDVHGHLFGDEVLLHFSQIIEKNFRYEDYLYRFGGEEFIVLIHNNTFDGASVALERFRKAIETYKFPTVGQVTVSIGYVSIEKDTLPTTQVDRADQALYNAKETGRNKLVYYNDIKETEEEQDTDIELF